MENADVNTHRGDRARIIVFSILGGIAVLLLFFAFFLAASILTAPTQSAASSSSASTSSSGNEAAEAIAGAFALGLGMALGIVFVFMLAIPCLVEGIIGTVVNFRHLARSEKPYSVGYLILGILHSLIILSCIGLPIFLRLYRA